MKTPSTSAARSRAARLRSAMSLPLEAILGEGVPSGLKVKQKVG